FGGVYHSFQPILVAAGGLEDFDIRKKVETVMFLQFGKNFRIGFKGGYFTCWADKLCKPERIESKMGPYIPDGISFFWAAFFKSTNYEGFVGSPPVRGAGMQGPAESSQWSAGRDDRNIT